MTYRLIHADCRHAMAVMPDASVDSIVTDPPYELGFMGKSWDATGVAYDVALWREALRILKPGGHLLAFGGSRTYHRMAVAIEDAGFEIRDQIMWIYGSGFPKSHNISKAVDKAAGAEREKASVSVLDATSQVAGNMRCVNCGKSRFSGNPCICPRPENQAITPEAQHWEGWGTALKPAFEPLIWARKPLLLSAERNITIASLRMVGARLWLLSNVKDAANHSPSNLAEQNAAFDIAQWNVEQLNNTRENLFGQTDTSQYVLMVNTSLNTVLSWLNTLGDLCSPKNTSTTKITLETTIDWKIWKSCLSVITLDSIIRVTNNHDGGNADANNAVRYLRAELSKLNATLELSVLEHAMSRVLTNCPEETVTPLHEPIVIARKPLVGTVAANVLAYGTGAINIDGCRIEGTITINPSNRGKGGLSTNGHDGQTAIVHDNAQGRFPANLIHDGSDEVLAGFPTTTTGAKSKHHVRSTNKTKNTFSERAATSESLPGSTGSAARFFYCAKTSKADRDEGLTGALQSHVAFQTANGTSGKASSISEGRDTQYRNIHPTVKPTDLMRYLCRLITPPGGTVFDPFTGSGSTGKAAMLEGFNFIGCELTAEYIPIANARIGHAMAKALELLR